MSTEIDDTELRSAILEYQETNSKRASTIICERFQGMIYQSAWKYVKSMELDDAIQNATLGVLRAAKKYDPNKKGMGTVFNYLERGAMDFLNRGLGFTIKIGKHSSRQLSFVKKEMEAGKTLETICKEQKWSKRRQKSIMNTLLISKTCTMPDKVDLASKRDSQEEIEKSEEWEIICNKIPKMTADEKRILYMKLEGRTLRYIAAQLKMCEGATRERIKKLYKKIAPRQHK